jgi:DNA-binding transcriptional LysR family regulator
VRDVGLVAEVPSDGAELVLRTPVQLLGGLTTMTRRLFADAGARLLPYAGEADSYRSVEDWANLGLGGALLPLSRFQPGARTRPVHRDGRPVTIHYEAQWLAETPRAAAIEDLLDRVVA